MLLPDIPTDPNANLNAKPKPSPEPGPVMRFVVGVFKILGVLWMLLLAYLWILGTTW